MNIISTTSSLEQEFECYLLLMRTAIAGLYPTHLLGCSEAGTAEKERSDCREACFASSRRQPAYPAGAPAAPWSTIAVPRTSCHASAGLLVKKTKRSTAKRADV